MSYILPMCKDKEAFEFFLNPILVMPVNLKLVLSGQMLPDLWFMAGEDQENHIVKIWEIVK